MQISLRLEYNKDRSYIDRGDYLSKPGSLLGLAILISFFLVACTAPASAGRSPTQPILRTSSATGATDPSQTHGGTPSPARSTPAALATIASTVGASAARTKTPLPSAGVISRPTKKPTLTPIPTNCLSQGGQIEMGSLETELLRLPLNFRVYIPPCYDLDEAQRYPVLYLFHGQSYTDDQWDRLGVDSTADRLIAAGEIPPFIMVMPHDRYGGQPTETKFSQAISDVLIPYIDQAYRTIPDRDHRAVGGLSRGAGWAVHFGISKWKLFGTLGAHSAAVFHTDAQRMRTWLSQFPTDQYPRIYVDIGDKDRPEIMRSTLWFEGLLNDYDIPHEWHLFSGYHAEEYWRAHLEQYLRWYTQGW